MNRALLLVVAAVAWAAPGVAAAQGNDLSEKRVTFESQALEVRDALKLLFKPLEGSYAVAPEVQGYVTVSFKDVAFETALQAIVLQVDASYRFEGGVYLIEPKAAIPPVIPHRPTTPLEAPKVIRRIYIRNTDPLLILRMLAGSQEMLAPWPSLVNRNSGIGGGFSWSGFGGSGSLGLSFGGGF